MFGNFDLSKLGEIVSQIQEQSQRLQAEMESKSYTAKSGGGLVSVSVNGKGEVIDVTIDDSLMEDREALQILLISAINDALAMAEADKKNSLMQLASLVGMPGGFGR
ncbi:MAG: YbaB/EbfC family nucleoid-associated protein [Campylobacterales bacterium]